MKKPLKLFFFFYFYLSCLAFAPATATLSFAAVQSSGAFGLESVGYLGSAHATKTSAFSSVFSKWEIQSQGPYLESYLKSHLSLNLFYTSYSFVEIPEVYLASSSKLSSAQVSIGRKIVNWNQLDRSWLLGVWQPRFRWDYLEPAPVGLFGVFFKASGSFFELGGFGSPIFIPERGVPVEYRDGVFTSLSPWFMSLPAHARLVETSQETTPITYNLVAPPVQKIISYPGAGIYGRLGASEGLWAQGAMAFKPINQLLIGYEGYYHHPLEKIKATLYPRVTYHALTSVEGGIKSHPVNAWVSLLKERPLRDETPSSWRTQELAPATALGSAVELSLFGRNENATLLELAYLRQWGGDAPDGGADGMPGMNSFESRYPFKDTARFGVRTLLPGSWGRFFNSRTRVLYDFQYEGTIFSTELVYKPNFSWSINLGADILSSTHQFQKGMSVDFINRYRANDRFHGGVTYVF